MTYAVPSIVRRSRLQAALITSLCCAACSDDDTAAPDKTSPAAASEQLYVGATRVFTADDSVGYLFATKTLDSDAEIDLGQALEMSDAWVFGKADPYFYTATIFEPSITRWTVSKSGDFEKGPTVNFSNEGVGGTYTAATVPLFSKDKAYFADPVSMQVVVWNPADMEFIRTIQIDAKPYDDFAPNMDLTLRGDQVVVSVFWVSEASGLTNYGDHVRVAVIDTKTDEVISSTDDTRCRSISSGGTAKDGTMYFSPWDYHTLVREVFGEEHGSPSCGLRLGPKDNELDASYEVDLEKLTGGHPAGSLKVIGDDVALIHAWHTDLVDPTPDDWQDTRFAPGYMWYRWHLGDETAELLPDQKPSTEGGEWRQLDKRIVTYAPDEEFAKTTLFELADDGAQQERITIPGWITNMLRAH